MPNIKKIATGILASTILVSAPTFLNAASLENESKFAKEQKIQRRSAFKDKLEDIVDSMNLDGKLPSVTPVKIYVSEIDPNKNNALIMLARDSNVGKKIIRKNKEEDLVRSYEGTYAKKISIMGIDQKHLPNNDLAIIAENYNVFISLVDYFEDMKKAHRLAEYEFSSNGSGKIDYVYFRGHGSPTGISLSEKDKVHNYTFCFHDFSRYYSKDAHGVTVGCENAGSALYANFAQSMANSFGIPIKANKYSGVVSLNESLDLVPQYLIEPKGEKYDLQGLSFKKNGVRVVIPFDKDKVVKTFFPNKKSS
jgi:hypothetical protein